MHQVDAAITSTELHDRVTSLQKLVNRYITQVRYGCLAEDCSHPHCWTCRKRLATSPPRRPTLLTARIQAYALATRRDPYAALCQHEPATGSLQDVGPDTTKINAEPVKKDKFSLVQCLLDSASFTVFEKRGLSTGDTLYPSKECAWKHGLETVDWQHRRVEVEQCMQDLKALFVKPVELSNPVVQTFAQHTEVEKLKILRKATIVALYNETPQRTSTELIEEPKLLLADRLVRAIAAQRCHWEIIHLASQPPTQYPAVELLVRSLLSDTWSNVLNASNQEHRCTTLTGYLDLINMEDSVNSRFPGTAEYFFQGCRRRALQLPPFLDPLPDLHPGDAKDGSAGQNGRILLRDLRVMARNLAGLLRQRWTGGSTMQRWDTIGASLEIVQELDHIWQFSWDCPLSRRYAFKETILHEFEHIMRNPREQAIAISFFNYEEGPNTRHLLSFPMLFDDAALVKHFRTLNYISMLGSYRQSHFYDLFINIGPRKIISDRGHQYLEGKLRAARARFLTLDIDREDVVEDAFNQLRGCEKRELARPLKVLIGRSEAGGEIGIDQGGLTQEFFALAAAEIFNEDFGMFTTDLRSSFSWFRPLSTMPLYKFELLGLMFSLALYNGAIIPVNMPLALYRLLLGEVLTDPVATVSDGWPDLAQSFQYMVDWEDRDPQGEVQDIADALMREYTFSFETPLFSHPLPEGWTALGRPTSRGYVLEYDLHMQNSQYKARHGIGAKQADQKPNSTEAPEDPEPPSSTQDGNMVTNSNRYEFIRDYVDFLVIGSVRPQYEAFAKGFKTLLTPKALSLLNPPLLQRLVEGDHSLDIDELERITTYENGYFPAHPVIKQFWVTVRSWTREKQRKLLEFVTASDRVPVTGLDTVAFSIVRNGAVENLPTGQTCFGKFNLPEYENKETLARMLDIALEYGQGFGVM